MRLIQRVRNAVHYKQVFLVFYETTLSDIQYLNLTGSLETPHGSYLYNCQPLP